MILISRVQENYNHRYLEKICITFFINIQCNFIAFNKKDVNKITNAIYLSIYYD